MSAKRTRDLPARLEDLRRRFEGWRRTRQGPLADPGVAKLPVYYVKGFEAPDLAALSRSFWGVEA
jgi:hypothetical protein